VKSVIYLFVCFIFFCSSTKQMANENLDQIKEQLIKKDDIFDGRWPEFTADGKWQFREKVNWFSGFIGGELFLMDDLTADPELNKRALKHADNLIPHAGIDYTHDMGFIFLPTCVQAYKRTGKEKYKNAALLAAEMLYKRYNPKGKFIRAWGKLGSEKRAGWIIVDTMMNLELLFWAYEITGDTKFYDAAVQHATTTLNQIVRSDYSTFHVVEMDPQNGKVLKKRTHQGFSDSSTWARGQAWAVYGFTNVYKRTKDKVFLQTAQKIADYYLKKLPQDYVPYWDLDLSGEDVLRDASAGAILASGLYDLAEMTDNKLNRKYKSIADKITQSLLGKYLFNLSQREIEQGILLHTIYNYHKNWGMDESFPAGDYYFVEAIHKYYNHKKRNAVSE